MQYTTRNPQARRRCRRSKKPSPISARHLKKLRGTGTPLMPPGETVICVILIVEGDVLMSFVIGDQSSIYREY
ncbi:hypothetical protein M0C91_03940 [Methanoculleus sp. 7T]|jgi:hypothetical protein|nr:hypothetical protein [Methanoculleus sp. 7T]